MITYPTQISIAFKQYNPKKPARYGMLFKSINACRYPYTFTSFTYAGKPRNHDSQPLCTTVRDTVEYYYVRLYVIQKKQ